VVVGGPGEGSWVSVVVADAGGRGPGCGHMVGVWWWSRL
jgi:hypothetical protein